MIKKMLNDLKIFISSLNEGPVENLRGKGAVLASIKTDLKQLMRKDPTFLDGPEGYIDYYSPHAEAQISNKQALLEKYIDQLMVLQATLICIHRKQAHLDSLLDNSDENKSKIADIKKKITELKTENNIEKLMDRKEIQREFKWIKKVARDRHELKAMDGQSHTDKARHEPIHNIRKSKLEKRIRAFDNDKYKIASLDPIQKQINGLQLKLDKHLRLKEKIPKGMIDVKRAISFQQELWSIQNIIGRKIEALQKLSEHSEPAASTPTAVNKLEQEIEQLRNKETQLSTIKFSTSDEVDIKIKDMLKDLRTLMTSSINGYKELAKSGGDIDVYLHQTTAYYWENLALYRKALSAIDKYVQSHASQLTAEGGLVVECMSSAADKLPKEKRINNALDRVKQADRLSSKRVATYRENEANKVPDSRYFKQAALNLIEQLKPLPQYSQHIVKESKPFFFIPSNSNLYNIDHPAHTDLAGTLGNCYGETHMFLLRANQKNPTFNNICPQTDLINFQLDQSRHAGDLDITEETFEAKSCGLIRLSTSPTDMEKSDLEKIIKMKPTYAIHGTEIYYIDGDLVIKNIPERTNESNLGSIFPEETNRQRVATVDEIYTLETTTKYSQDQSIVKWDNIQSILTGSVDDTKNGAIYTIKLSGATTEPDDNGKRTPFAHVLGFIHMKNPDPYKYIVYDYGLGPIGISSDEQLEAFFKYVLDYYPAFPEYVIKKIDNVSDECQNFFNGPDGIKPLDKAGQGHQCERNFWNKQRLLLLIKYSNGDLNDVKLVLEKVKSLKSSEAKGEVYRSLFSNENMKPLDLLSQSVILATKGDYEPIINILEQSDFLNGQFSEPLKKHLNKQMVVKLSDMILNGDIPAVKACGVFRTNESIVLAAFKKDKTSLQFADYSIVINFIRNNKISYKDALDQVPHLSDQTTILNFIDDQTITPEQAIRLFYFDYDIVHAAYFACRSQKGRANLAREAHDLLIDEINKWSDQKDPTSPLKKAFTSENIPLKKLKELTVQLKEIKQALTEPSQREEVETSVQLAPEHLQQELEAMRAIDVTASLNEMQSDSSENGQDARPFDEFLLLLSNNPEYRQSYVGLIESSHKMDLGILMKAHTQFGEKVVINAMDLTAKHGWDKAKIYLALKEKNQNATADTYYNGLMVHSTDYINEQRKYCLNYIEEISKAQFGTKDIKSNAYCEGMKKYIESPLFDLSISNSDAILQELQTIHAAVTSPGMKAVQKQVERLEENARGMIGIGNQNKANNIRAAVCNVPLHERGQLLTEQASEACQKVGVELARHRIETYKNKRLQTTVDEKVSPAQSYKNAMRELKEQGQASNPTDSGPRKT